MRGRLLGARIASGPRRKSASCTKMYEQVNFKLQGTARTSPTRSRGSAAVCRTRRSASSTAVRRSPCRMMRLLKSARFSVLTGLLDITKFSKTLIPGICKPGNAKDVLHAYLTARVIGCRDLAGPNRLLLGDGDFLRLENFMTPEAPGRNPNPILIRVATHIRTW